MTRVRPDNRNRRTDTDALEGMFCKAVSGPYAGRMGVLHRVDVYNEAGDGYPTRVIVREARTDALLACAYSDVAPLAPTDRAGYG